MKFQIGKYVRLKKPYNGKWPVHKVVPMPPSHTYPGEPGITESDYMKCQMRLSNIEDSDYEYFEFWEICID